MWQQLVFRDDADDAIPESDILGIEGELVACDAVVGGDKGERRLEEEVHSTAFVLFREKHLYLEIVGRDTSDANVEGELEVVTYIEDRKSVV